MAWLVCKAISGDSELYSKIQRVRLQIITGGRGSGDIKAHFKNLSYLSFFFFYSVDF